MLASAVAVINSTTKFISVSSAAADAFVSVLPVLRFICSTAAEQAGIEEGVVFLTYASLISSSDKGETRLQQLIQWAGPQYDGLIIFDECHKAKNLIPEAGGKPTKVTQAASRL